MFGKKLEMYIQDMYLISGKELANEHSSKRKKERKKSQKMIY